MPLEGRMPRPPDPGLEDRILNAAHKLWKKDGSKALTMRAVARAADTNTPAVYRRFRQPPRSVRALLRRSQQEFGSILQPCRSVEEAVAAYLRHALESILMNTNSSISTSTNFPPGPALDARLP